MENPPKFLFDYVYYRISKAYRKWDGETGTTAIATISFAQMVPLSLVLSKVSFALGVGAFVSSGTVAGICVVAIAAAIIINARKFKGSYSRFDAHWKNESNRQKLLKGFLVFLVAISPVFFMIVLGMKY